MSYNENPSYSPVGGSSSITKVGTVTSGTWQGTPVSQAYGGSGQSNFSGNMVLIQSQTASNSASLPFSGITTTYDQYMFIWYGVTLSAGTNQLYLQYSTDNNSTHITTGYTDQGFQCTNAGLFQSESGGDSGIPLTTYSDTNSQIPSAGNIRLDLPWSTTFYKMAYRTGYEYQSPAGYWTYEGSMNGNTSTSAVNAFLIIPASGTITTGTFKLYGIQN